MTKGKSKPIFFAQDQLPEFQDGTRTCRVTAEARQRDASDMMAEQRQQMNTCRSSPNLLLASHSDGKMSAAKEKIRDADMVAMETERCDVTVNEKDMCGKLSDVSAQSAVITKGGLMSSLAIEKLNYDHNLTPSRSGFANSSNSMQALLCPQGSSGYKDVLVGEKTNLSIPLPASSNGIFLPQQLTHEPSGSQILAAIQALGASIHALTAQMGGIKEEVLMLRQDIRKMADRTEEVEHRVGDLEDQIRPLRSGLEHQEKDVTMLYRKVDDLENKLRRNNIRMVGVPEGVEGKDPTKFFGDWIRETFDSQALSSQFAIERAYRIPTRPSPPGRPPRPMLLQFLHFKDRDAVLRMARDMQAINIQGERVSCYPDFSAEVQRRRQQFTDIKKRLRLLHLKYSMLYPAKLRVEALSSTFFFENPKEAVLWLDVNAARFKQDSGM